MESSSAYMVMPTRKRSTSRPGMRSGFATARIAVRASMSELERMRRSAATAPAGVERSSAGAMRAVARSGAATPSRCRRMLYGSLRLRLWLHLRRYTRKAWTSSDRLAESEALTVQSG